MRRRRAGWRALRCARRAAPARGPRSCALWAARGLPSAVGPSRRPLVHALRGSQEWQPNEMHIAVGAVCTAFFDKQVHLHSVVRVSK